MIKYFLYLMFYTHTLTSYSPASLNTHIFEVLKIISVITLITTINWFGDTKLALWPLILMSVWQFGSSMIIFAAGLKEIPTSYYEAAEIDGASFVSPNQLMVESPALESTELNNPFLANSCFHTSATATLPPTSEGT